MTVVRLRVRLPRVAAATIRGRGLYGIIVTMAFVRLLLLLQLLLSTYTMNLTSREVKARNFASLFDQEFFAFESIAAHDLI